MQRSQKLTRRQEATLLALMSHSTVADAARAAKISESSLWRWLQEPEFQHRHREMRRSVVEHAIAELQTLTSDAVATLRRLLNSGHKPTEARTALGILMHATEAVKLVDLAARIEELERVEAARKTRTA